MCSFHFLNDPTQTFVCPGRKFCGIPSIVSFPLISVAIDTGRMNRGSLEREFRFCASRKYYRMPSTTILIAQEPANTPPAKDKQAAPGPFGDPMFMLMMLGMAFVFLFILPARQQRRQQEQLFAAIKKGAKVVTVGGIIGTIENIKDNEDEITLRTGDAKMRVTKSSIGRVLGQEDSEAQ
jgi:preprotein translocase subunit YajC